MPLRNTTLYDVGKRAFRSSRQSFRKLSFKSYWTAKAYTSLCSLPGRHQVPILIYQMGKVGSTTIRRSLQNSQLDHPIYKIHTLSKYGINRVNDCYRDIKKSTNKFNWETAKHVFESEILAKETNRNIKDKNWKIITLVRDPISRNISSFFQSIDLYLPDFSQQILSDSVTINELIEIFKNKFDHELPLKWFDMELNNVFNFDVFKTEFDTLKCYKIYKKDNIDVLLIKTEHLNLCIKEAFKEFLDIEIKNVEEKNVGDHKYYYSIYKKFMESIIFSEKYIEKMYTSKYVNHFYSAEEIQSFRDKWKR